MAYPERTNPRHLRSLLDNVYAGYASGQDRFPRKRLRGDVFELPYKTQPIAQLLVSAWEQIDLDRDYFGRAVVGMVDTLRKSKTSERPGLVITRIGKNVVNYAEIDVTPLQPAVTITEFRREEFLDKFAGHQFAMVDGGAVTLREDGEFDGPVDGFIRRDGNDSGIFGLSVDQTLDLMSAVSSSPVSAVINPAWRP